MAHRFLLHEPSNVVDPRVLSDMFFMRQQVFKQRLGWSVHERHSLERDCYDLMGATYCLCVDSSDRVIGCWRLLPTNGPYLLRDVFADLLDGHEPPNDTRVWEASRFAVRNASGSLGSRGQINEATVGLIAALLECGLNFGIERIVAVCDLKFERILRRSGLQTNRFGQPRQVGNTVAVAGWFDVTEDNLTCIRETNGLQDDVLFPSQTLGEAA